MNNFGLSYEGVVILGSPRSGTTMLRRLLDAHPKLSCPPETNLLRAASLLFDGDETAIGFSTSVIDALAFAGFSENEVVDRTREFIFGFFRDICHRNDKQIWVEKSALDAFHVDSVFRLCGDHCRYLYLHRDPIDCIWSMHEYYANGIQVYVNELHRFVQRYPAPLEAMAHAWVEANDALIRLVEKQPTLVHSVKYEELISEPVSVIRGILDFLGLDGDVEMIVSTGLEDLGQIGFGDAKTYERRYIDKASTGQGSAKLTATTIARLTDIVGPTMELLGYRLPDAVIDDPETARRRYEIGRMLALKKAE